MSAQHTPGPWEAELDADRERYCIGHRRVPLGQRCVAIVSFGYDEPAESEQHANARLIAAAPELLACVKDFEDALVSYDKDKPNGISMHLSRLRDVREAIAKAEGRS